MTSRPRSGRRLAAALLGAGCFCTTAWMATPAVADEETNGLLALDELRTFADVFNRIRQGYVEEIDDSTLLEYAIEGMLSGLDPHSVYLSRDAFEDLQTSTTGEFSGLGLEVGMDNGLLRVIAPIDGSPAAEAGIQPGDIILKLDNTPIKGMPMSEAVNLMRGPVGTAIELTVGRSGELQPLNLELVRDVIKVASVRERWLEPGFGYVRISQFQKDTGADVAAAVQRLLAEEPLRGLVLDLRNNPGGVLGASVDVAGVFMRGGLVVYTEGRLPNAGQRYEADPDDLIDGAPMVVLINGGSASASEIVAGALQDHGRAIIMGTDSFGKGSVQTVLPISESRAVKLTTALYFTPSGRSIQAEGIVPDILVERARLTALSESGRITEADLSRHLENRDSDAEMPAEGEAGNGEEGSSDGATASRAQQLLSSRALQSRDNQLYEALTLLKGVHLLSARR
jgi:carboxyl-terminal processing protease